MKKTMAILSAAAAVAGLAYFGSRSHAQNAAPARSKIALVNVAKVLKGYNKANTLGQQLVTRTKQYTDLMNAERAKGVEIEKQAKAPAATQQQRETAEGQLKQIQRAIEDLESRARADITKEQNAILIQVYNEIQGVVQAYAASNDIELVLYYPDATEPAELNTVPVIMSKLRPAAAMPAWHRGLDISDHIIRTLNASYPVAAQPAAGTQGGVPGQPASYQQPVQPAGAQVPQQPQYQQPRQ